MKNLELNQMEILEGGANNQAVLCGISIGLMVSGGGFFWGAALFMIACVNGDTGTN